MKNIIILILCLTLCVVAKAQYLDCVDALPICSSGSLNYSSSGAGTDDFANTNNDNGCLLFGEHQSVWLVIKISQLSAPGANLGFTLTPNAAGGDDFDFAVYGPLSNCNNLGSPIRCSYANATLDNCGYCPQTGLGNGATDPIEGATGDGFVANLITYPSEVYYILIDNFSASYDGFSLEWTGNAELDCNLNCFANPGTFSLAGSANNETTNFPLQYTDNYVLCPGDGITFQTDENYILPSAVGQEDASMLWALYTAPPPPAPSPNDPGFSGVLIDEDFITTINTAGTQSNLPAQVNLTNSTLWIVPVTGDDGNTNGNPNGTISIDADGDGCYVYGEPFAITYLEEIEVLPRTTCTELILKITNGMPAVFGGSYTISNFQPTYAQISNTTPGYEQDISVYNLNYGDSYSFDITDSNGCTSSFSGVFEYNGPRPDANATPNMSACPLEAITLNAWTYAWGTEFSYSWTGPGGFTSNQQNPTIPAIAGNYNVVVTVDGCESNPATTVVEVLDAPILDPIPDQANCSNSFDLSTINLTGTNLIGADFNYYADANGAPGNPITPIVVTSGTYWIEAIPTNNNLTCNGLQQVEVILGNITVTINSIQSVSCQGLADGAINTNISGGQAPFTFEWSGTDANTEDPEGLAPGLYTLTVTDALGCMGVLEVQVPEVTAMDIQILDISDPDCGTSNNGSISLAVTGGTAPHSIIWSNGATGFLNGQLGAGDYSYTITDANNCTLISTEAISLNAPSDLSISQTVVEPDCGNNAGSISIIVTGGSGNYTYTWPHDPTNTSNSANNLSSGPYVVSVSDEVGCTISQTISVSNLGGPEITLDSIQAETCFQDNGAASLTVSGGTGQIFLSWAHDPSLFESSISGVSAGTYVLTASDEAGCQSSITIEIPAIEPPTLSIQSIQNATCDEATNGAISLQVSGGMPPFQYVWSHDADLEGPSADNLPPGNWGVAVIDSNGCFSSFGFQIEALNLQELEIDNMIPASCDQANGSITLTLTNAEEPVEYTWVHDADLAGPTAENLLTGDYTAFATDANGCTSRIDFTLPNLDGPQLASTTTDASGCIIPDGTMAVTITGGFPPYTYSWSHDNSLNSATATNLFIGEYTLTVTDANGCSNIITDEVLHPNDLVLDTLRVEHALCEEPTGAIYLYTEGGVGPYTYEWNPPVSTDSFAINLPAGTYYSTVTDAVGCTAIDTIIVEDFGEVELGPEFDLIFVKDENCGQGNGAISIQVDENTDLIWSGHPEFGSAPDLDSLSAGTYNPIIPGPRVCTDLGGITVGNIPPPVIQVDSTQNLTCSRTPFAAVSAEGGEGAYTFSWSHAPDIDTTYIPDLPVGEYGVSVSDAFGCTDSTSLTIEEQFPPVLEIALLEHTTCDDNNGQIVVLASGGTGELTYEWSHNTFLNSDTARFLVAGLYTLTVRDEENCVVDTTLEVLASEKPNLELVEQIDATCGDNIGSATVEAIGGAAPYWYTWSHNDQLSSNIATSLGSGAYTVLVEDANNCLDSLVVDINDTERPNLSLEAVVLDSCESSLGSITIAASGGTGELSINWLHDTTNHTLMADSLLTGYYSVVVSDENDCKASESIFLETSPLPEIYLLDVAEVECSASDGSILVMVNDSTTDLSYNWAHDSTLQSPLATGLEIGNYSITVSNAAGCSASANFGVPGTTAPLLDIANFEPVNCNQPLGQVELSISLGTPPFQFSWSHNDSLNSPLAENLAGGYLELYTATVVDSNECSDSIRFNMPAYQAPMAIIDSLNGAFCDDPSGLALLKAVPFAQYRINCGWTHDTILLDQDDIYYEQDSLYAQGGVPYFSSTAISNTSNEFLFQHRRIDSSGFEYHFPLFDGQYIVRLGFAEISTHQANLETENRFNVWIEGENVLSNFNVFETFGTNDANWLEFPVSVIDASLDLEFETITGFAQLSAVEIIPLNQAPLNYSWEHDNALQGPLATGLAPGNYQVNLSDEQGCESELTVQIGNVEIDAELSVSTALDTCNIGTGLASISVSADPAMLRINCGGPEYTDTNGLLFEADEAGEDDQLVITNQSISNTSEEALYQTARKEASYELSLPNGNYQLILHFAEIGDDPEELPLLFNLEVEETTLLKNYNINQEAGGLNTAITVAQTITLMDGTLNINAKTVQGYGMISAIEVLPMLDEPLVFDYNWSHNPNLQSNSADQLIAGNYSITVYDNLGCAEELDFIVSPTPQVQFDIETEYADCGFANGSAVVQIDPGNLVVNGDFSAGNISFSTDYNYTTGNTGNGRYTITSNASDANGNFDPCEDHTEEGTLFMVVNGLQNANNNVWCQEIEVIPGITYDIEAWFTAVRPANPAELQFSINGELIGTSLPLSDQTCNWQALTESWLADTAAIEFCIINLTGAGWGNEFGVDDIAFRPQAYSSDFVWEHDPNLVGEEAQNLAPGVYYVSTTDNYGCEFRDSLNITNFDGTEFVVSHIDRPGCDLYNGGIRISGAPQYRINAGGSPFIAQLTGNLFDTDTLFANGFSEEHDNAVGITEDDGLYQSYRVGNFEYNLPIEEAGEYEIVLYFSEPDLIDRTFDITIEGQLVANNFNIFSEVGLNQALIQRYNTTVSDGLLTISFDAEGGNPILSGLEVYQAIPANTNFSWMHDTNVNSELATGLTRGDFMVQITESNSCISELNINLEFPPNPQLSLLGSVEPAACLGVLGNAVVEAEGNGGYVFAWSHDASLNSTTAENLSSAIYTVSVTDINNCKDTMDIELLDLTIPEIILDSLNNSLCNNDQGSIFVSAAGGAGSYEFSWVHDDSLTVPFATDLFPGNYTVRVVDKNGCTSQQTYPITTSGPILEVVTIEDTFCDSLTGSIIVTEVGNPAGETTYFWSHDPNLDTTAVDNLSSGDYFIIGQDEFGCIDTVFATINNTEGPGILDILTEDSDHCYENTGTAQLVLTESTTIVEYDWSHDPNLVGLSASNLAPGSYTVSVTDANGCMNETAFEIIGPEPFELDVVVAQDATCSEMNGTAQVQVTGGTNPFNFNWSHNPNINASQVNNLAGGTYTLTVTDASFCTETITLSINSFNAPSILSANIQPTFCALNIGEVALSVNSNSDSVYFQWSHTDTLHEATANNLSAGTYTVTITDDENCSIEETFEVTTINEEYTSEESVNICDGSEFLYEGISYATDTTFCLPYLTAEGCDSIHCITVQTLNHSLTYLQEFSCNEEEVGIFADTLVNQLGCDSIVITNIAELEKDTTYLEEFTCNAEEAGVFTNYLLNQAGCDSMVVLTVEPLRKDTVHFRYETCDPDLLGSYVDYFTNMEGCDSMVVTEYVEVEYELEAEIPEVINIELGDSIPLEIIANFDPAYIEWFPATGLSCTDCIDPVAYLTEGQTYGVYLMDENGCDISLEFRVDVDPICDIYVPNAFSPNGDGINDLFTVYSAPCVDEVEQLLVFDRWGELVFEANGFRPNEVNFGWDGIFRGEPMNPAVFAWFTKVRLVNGESVILKGDLTLVK